MAHYDARLAVAGRDDGVRKVVRLTWRTGIIGAALSALFGLTLGHAHHASPPHQQNGIVIPGQPPKPANGGGLVTSGAS